MESLTKTAYSPFFNLTAVLHETGLKADVLRAWERRYNLPKPQRTPGGHRLYSQHDIEIIKWLKARQEEGLSISSAVALWRGVVSSGIDPLAPTTLAHSKSSTAKIDVKILRDSWLQACMEFDGPKAESVLDKAFTQYPAEIVVTEILQESLNGVGVRWEEGIASVQQEHFLSALALQKLETLIANLPDPIREQTILVACPSGEWHIFPGLMINYLLKKRGFRVVNLGANTPLYQLKETISQIKPNVVVLSSQQLTTAATLKTAAVELSGSDVQIAYGGLIFNRNLKLQDFIPATYLGPTILDAVDQIEHMVISNETPKVKSEPKILEPSITRLFNEKRPWIELKVLEKMSLAGYKVTLVASSNRYFGDSILAALDLGSITLLEADLTWINVFLNPRVSDKNILTDFLRFWGEQLEVELGEQGKSLNNWMKSFASTIENISSH